MEAYETQRHWETLPTERSEALRCPLEHERVGAVGEAEAFEANGLEEHLA